MYRGDAVLILTRLPNISCSTEAYIIAFTHLIVGVHRVFLKGLQDGQRHLDLHQILATASLSYFIAIYLLNIPF